MEDELRVSRFELDKANRYVSNSQKIEKSYLKKIKELEEDKERISKLLKMKAEQQEGTQNRFNNKFKECNILEFKLLKVDNKVKNLLSIVKDMVVQLHKFKIQHEGLKKKVKKIKQMEDKKMGKGVFETRSLTPRPDWEKMKNIYKIKELEGCIEEEDNNKIIQPSSLMVEKLCEMVFTYEKKSSKRPRKSINSKSRNLSIKSNSKINERGFMSTKRIAKTTLNFDDPSKDKRRSSNFSRMAKTKVDLHQRNINTLHLIQSQRSQENHNMNVSINGIDDMPDSSVSKRYSKTSLNKERNTMKDNLSPVLSQNYSQEFGLGMPMLVDMGSEGGLGKQGGKISKKKSFELDIQDTLLEVAKLQNELCSVFSESDS